MSDNTPEYKVMPESKGFVSPMELAKIKSLEESFNDMHERGYELVTVLPNHGQSPYSIFRKRRPSDT